DCVVTPLKTLMGFSVHLNVQLKFYNLPLLKRLIFNCCPYSNLFLIICQFIFNRILNFKNKLATGLK
ncbi:hypothetical protein FOL87_10495, partial [Lactobacillus reuteri]|nr:hypothetical protein [Limosilactobacillus reuteri]